MIIATKWRKRPVVIEAVMFSFWGQDWPQDWPVANWHYNGEHLVIPTLGGNMLADHGDWVIKGIKGEFYPCKPDIFAATYELA
jgi:hypothetical protein